MPGCLGLYDTGISQRRHPGEPVRDEIINRPEQLAAQYEKLWNEQLSDPKAFYITIRHFLVFLTSFLFAPKPTPACGHPSKGGEFSFDIRHSLFKILRFKRQTALVAALPRQVNIRDKFNRTGDPHLFLYLLARCVKASVRYNTRGEFNQNPDNRRNGMKPHTMKMQIMGASYFLEKKTTTASTNYRDVLKLAEPEDLVYMDPPYQKKNSSKLLARNAPFIWKNFLKMTYRLTIGFPLKLPVTFLKI